MTQLRQLVRAQINQLGEREVEVVMSTDALARDTHVLVPQGCQIRNYLANPIVLWSHDYEQPIGNNHDVAVGPDRITARAVFAPAGISHKADEICGLVKAGVIRAVSIAFDVIDMEPLDPAKPRGGQRITKWELLEMSFVSVPADTGAVVTARQNPEIDGAQSMSEATETVAAPAPRTRGASGVRRGAKLTLKRGLYQVAELCWLFEELGWQLDMAKYEAAAEADDSKVPGMLAGVFHDLGEALLAMSQEEIAEALAGHDVELVDDEDDDVLEAEIRANVVAGKTPAVRAWRRGVAHAKLRAGKMLSAETIRCLREAKASHEDAIELARSAIRKHKDGMAAVDDLMDSAGVSDDEDDTDTQTSEGDEDVEAGDRAAADFRRRQVEKFAFSAF